MLLMSNQTECEGTTATQWSTSKPLPRLGGSIFVFKRCKSLWIKAKRLHVKCKKKDKKETVDKEKGKKPHNKIKGRKCDHDS